MIFTQSSRTQGRADWKFLVMVVLTIGSMGVAAYVWYRPRETASMAFTYRVSEVLSAKGPEAERFEIKWRAKQVTNASLVLVRLQNDGGRSFTRADFDPPLTLRLPSQATLVDTGLDSTSRDDLKPHLSVTANRVTIEPATFDVGDWVAVRLLVANCNTRAGHSPVALSGHVAGVKRYVMRPEAALAVRASPTPHTLFAWIWPAAVGGLLGLVLSWAFWKALALEMDRRLAGAAKPSAGATQETAAKLEDLLQVVSQQHEQNIQLVEQFSLGVRQFEDASRTACEHMEALEKALEEPPEEGDAPSRPASK